MNNAQNKELVITKEELNTVKSAMNHVWKMIASDFWDENVEYQIDNLEALYLVVDADRLERFGCKEAAEIFRNLIRDNELEEVQLYLDKRIQLV